MTATDLIVSTSDLTQVRRIASPIASTPPAPGQVKLQVDRFGWTSNNLSYAAAGDMLGYWRFFPTDEPGWGIVPVWGFATVIESAHPEIGVGEEIFGYLPLGRYLMVEPKDVSDVGFSDRYAHRSDLHPWYNRYERVAASSPSTSESRVLQPLLWALHMTGWMLADQLANAETLAANVIIASASSKTAISLARSLQVGGAGGRRVGLTSAANEPFVRSLGCYDDVKTYDAMSLDDEIDGSVCLVDMSGNAAVVSEVHHTFGDRLVDSIRVGGTHLQARGNTDGLPGPERRFFFIPDVAEERSTEIGVDAYLQRFAESWLDHAAWIHPFLSVTTQVGLDAMEQTYRSTLRGEHDPTRGLLLQY